MLGKLKEEVCRANRMLPECGLVTFTWGNVSGIDRERGLVVIKPSGVEYDALTPDDMAVVRLKDGESLEGGLRPSSDTDTHLELYRGCSDIGGIVHTHSRYATAWAQACRSIPALGTTHADDFHGDIPCTRALTAEEVRGSYEAETGRVILETFKEKSMMEIPAVLVASHGPFVWGPDAVSAVKKAVVLEEAARMALYSEAIAGKMLRPVDTILLDRHYFRKHGKDAYYGQK